ncbi:hypothetical protein G5V59_26410 [Nocardioides sp. W3-2-3]|uniref:hypothetical protein n=1 Tax=Nocardioides convexus TaxID=2712224 RepID=UPI002418BBEE|nr:hypothetical protein [Nocardioides convexus]NHA01964.1 hypothetical protein [Nocardioides convexus]
MSLRSTLSHGARLARDPRHLYARHLLGCLDEAAQGQALDARPDGAAARRRQSLFLEFSAAHGAPDGAAGTPGAPDGLVRRVDPERVRAAIEASGGVVEQAIVVPGEDMLGTFDPVVCRIRAAWPARTTHTPRGTR